MEFKDLIPLSDYVLQQGIVNYTDLGNWEDDMHFNSKKAVSILRYAKFLKQPLKLSMFIPCDENEKPLEKPSNFDIWKNTNHYGSIEIQQYQKALDNVIFEGFEVEKGLSEGSYRIYLNNILIIVLTRTLGFNLKYKKVQDLTHLNIEAKY